VRVTDLTDGLGITILLGQAADALQTEHTLGVMWLLTVMMKSASRLLQRSLSGRSSSTVATMATIMGRLSKYLYRRIRTFGSGVRYRSLAMCQVSAARIVGLPQSAYKALT
jgi:hypothetical protein